MTYRSCRPTLRPRRLRRLRRSGRALRLGALVALGLLQVAAAQPAQAQTLEIGGRVDAIYTMSIDSAANAFDINLNQALASALTGQPLIQFTMCNNRQQQSRVTVLSRNASQYGAPLLTNDQTDSTPIQYNLSIGGTDLSFLDGRAVFSPAPPEAGTEDNCAVGALRLHLGDNSGQSALAQARAQGGYTDTLTLIVSAD